MLFICFHDQKSKLVVGSGTVYCLSRINRLLSKLMKKYFGFLLIISIILSSCASGKPYYKTAEGKRKQKYYNDIQYGGKKARGY